MREQYKQYGQRPQWVTNFPECTVLIKSDFDHIHS